jgi:hypothetical protein
MSVDPLSLNADKGGDLDITSDNGSDLVTLGVNVLFLGKRIIASPQSLA